MDMSVNGILKMESTDDVGTVGRVYSWLETIITEMLMWLAMFQILVLLSKYGAKYLPLQLKTILDAFVLNVGFLFPHLFPGLAKDADSGDMKMNSRPVKRGRSRKKKNKGKSVDSKDDEKEDENITNATPDHSDEEQDQHGNETELTEISSLVTEKKEIPHYSGTSATLNTEEDPTINLIKNWPNKLSSSKKKKVQGSRSLKKPPTILEEDIDEELSSGSDTGKAVNSAENSPGGETDEEKPLNLNEVDLVTEVGKRLEEKKEVEVVGEGTVGGDTADNKISNEANSIAETPIVEEKSNDTVDAVGESKNITSSAKYSDIPELMDHLEAYDSVRSNANGTTGDLTTAGLWPALSNSTPPSEDENNSSTVMSEDEIGNEVKTDTNTNEPKTPVKTKRSICLADSLNLDGDDKQDQSPRQSPGEEIPFRWTPKKSTTPILKSTLNPNAPVFEFNPGYYLGAWDTLTSKPELPPSLPPMEYGRWGSNPSKDAADLGYSQPTTATPTQSRSLTGSVQTNICSETEHELQRNVNNSSVNHGVSVKNTTSNSVTFSVLTPQKAIGSTKIDGFDEKDANTDRLSRSMGDVDRLQSYDYTPGSQSTHTTLLNGNGSSLDDYSWAHKNDSITPTLSKSAKDLSMSSRDVRGMGSRVATAKQRSPSTPGGLGQGYRSSYGTPQKPKAQQQLGESPNKIFSPQSETTVLQHPAESDASTRSGHLNCTADVDGTPHTWADRSYQHYNPNPDIELTANVNLQLTETRSRRQSGKFRESLTISETSLKGSLAPLVSPALPPIASPSTGPMAASSPILTATADEPSKALTPLLEQAEKLFSEGKYNEILKIIEDLPPEEKTETRHVMAAWQNTYVKTSRLVGTTTNGDIVRVLLEWIQQRDGRFPPSDINTVFFMLGRNREYELLVLVFKAIVELTVSKYNEAQKEAAAAEAEVETGKVSTVENDSKMDADSDNAPVSSPESSTVDSRNGTNSGKESESQSGSDSGGISNDAETEGDITLPAAEVLDQELNPNGNLDLSIEDLRERCAPLDIKGCGAAIQAATEIGATDIYREVCDLIHRLTTCCRENDLSLPVNERLYYNIVSHWVRKDMLDLAEQTVWQARSINMANSRFYHLLLGSYATQKNWAKVEHIIMMSSGVLSMRQTFNLRVRMAAEQGNVPNMHALLEEANLDSSRIDEYAYYHLLKGFTSKREVAASEKLFESMEQEAAKPDTKLTNGIGCPVYILMFDLYFKSKKPESALMLFQQVKLRGKQTHAIYAQMVRNLTYAGRWSDAITILTSMNDSGYADLEIHGLLVNKLYEAGKKHEAASLLNDKRPLYSKQTKEKLPLAASSTILIRSAGHLECLHFAFGVYELYRADRQCDSFMINSLIDALIINNKSQKAIQLYKQMRSDGLEPDCVTYNTIIRAFANEADLDSALHILTEMREHSVSPNVVTYNTMVHTCVQLGRYAKAWKIVDEMQADNVDPDCATFTSLISSIKHMRDNNSNNSWGWNGGWNGKNNKGKGKKGREYIDPESFGICKHEVLDRAFADVLKLQRKGDRIDGVLIRALLDACAHCGRPDLAERTFNLGTGIFKFSQFEYGLLIKCYSQQRDLNSALRVKQRMEIDCLPLNAVVFGALIDLCLKVSEDRRAEELFAEMEALNIPHSIISMSLKIKMYGRLNKPDEAMATLYRIQQLGLTPGILTLNSVIDSVARTGGHHYFQEILEMIKQYNLVPNGCTYSIIAKGYAQGGLLDKAWDTFKMMERNGFCADPVTYNSLLDGCAKEGRCDLAEQLLCEMEKRNVGPNAITYSILIKLYVAKDITKAYNILDQLKHHRFLGDMKGGGKRWNNQSNNHSSEGGDSSNGNSNPLRVSYSAFIHALASSGDVSRGKHLIERMRADGFSPDGFHYASLAIAAGQQGKLPLAIEFCELASMEKVVLSGKTHSSLLRIAERRRDYKIKDRLKQMLTEGIFQPGRGIHQ